MQQHVVQWELPVEPPRNRPDVPWTQRIQPLLIDSRSSTGSACSEAKRALPVPMKRLPCRPFCHQDGSQVVSHRWEPSFLTSIREFDRFQQLHCCGVLLCLPYLRASSTEGPPPGVRRGFSTWANARSSVVQFSANSGSC